jgi:molybdopterin/thiamine biosynthesis adenylyltransferase
MTNKQMTPLGEFETKSMLIAGVGNIGSALAPLLARMGVGKIILVDPDDFEATNLRCQAIFACDIGKPKAVVQARRLCRINPAIDVRACCTRIEELPQGFFCVDAIASCLDSRISRRYVNQVAWRLGVPWIDAAVDAASLLARVNVYVPGPEEVCLECSYDPEDYSAAALEQSYPCGQGGGPAPTNAPASLGAIAAGLMAVECEKLLTGDRENLLAGRQAMVDLRHHTHYVTAFRRQHCRFDHEIWNIERVEEQPTRLTLGGLLQLAGNEANGGVRVEGQHFAALQFCPACGHHESHALHLSGRIPPARRRCPSCPSQMIVRGFDQREWIDSQALGEADLARPLSSLGVQPRDLLSVRGASVERHFLLAAPPLSRTSERQAARRPRSAQEACQEVSR